MRTAEGNGLENRKKRGIHHLGQAHSSVVLLCRGATGGNSSQFGYTCAHTQTRRGTLLAAGGKLAPASPYGLSHKSVSILLRSVRSTPSPELSPFIFSSANTDAVLLDDERLGCSYNTLSSLYIVCVCASVCVCVCVHCFCLF